jgi:hypothetical protein
MSKNNELYYSEIKSLDWFIVKQISQILKKDKEYIST